MEIFHVQGTDRRKELIEAVEQNQWFTTQKPSGQDVQAFHPDYGFILLKKTTHLKSTLSYMQRIAACAKLSLGPRLELRERLGVSFQGESFYLLGAVSSFSASC